MWFFSVIASIIQAGFRFMFVSKVTIRPAKSLALILNNPMKKLLACALSTVLSLAAVTAFAADDYNAPPAGDKQYAACLVYSNKNYEGGNEKSPVKGQTKAQAFCTCMWNETPDDFKGSLARFAETSKGKEINKTCEKHSDWGN
jgi:hypothetical protein